jgi:two-component system OmpR family response regulator/two-component system response regulator QseB
MRVLVVEDDDGIAQGLKAHLHQQGWAVDVTDGVGGLACRTV